MRRAYIAGNWKMNHTPSEAKKFASELKRALEENKIDCRVMVAPSFVDLPYVIEVLKDTEITVSAQNMANHTSGAYTGEVSPIMLKDIGVYTTILGHSERRMYYSETDEIINSKVRLALNEKMEVILCIGETLEERESGKLKEVLKRQIEKGLEGVKSEEMKAITLAYEPVWAIGTGKTASPEDADEAQGYARSVVESLYSKDIAENLIIQYGGSVKASNVKALMAKENVDGALVGGASLTIDQFLPIITFNK